MPTNRTPARRPRGTGSLVERKLSDGTVNWVAQFRAEGRLVKRTLGPKRKPGGRTGLTKTDAEHAMRELMTTYEPPKKVVEPEPTTVAAAGAALLADMRRRGRKKATIEGYDTVLRKHVGAYWPDTQLVDVRKQDVAAFLDWMEGGGGTGVVRSTKTVRNAYKVLHALFEYAERQELCVGNPAKKVTPPAAPEAALSDGGGRWLSVEEVEAACRTIPTDDWGRVERALYVTAAWTGMRQGELLALRWRDIRWDSGSIYVARSYVRGEYVQPKSGKGRVVPLVDRVRADLEQLSRSTAYAAPDDLVFAHPHLGGPLDRTKVTRRWQSAVKAAGLPPHRFHDLRHTFATTMLNALRKQARANPTETVQAWLGHADARTTRSIYAAWIHDDADTAAAQAAYNAATGADLVRSEGDLDAALMP